MKTLPTNARTWIYQSNRELTADEVEKVCKAGEHFVAGWASHGAELRAAFEVRYNRFVILMVDEAQAMASGCSIDKSVHFVQALERELGVSFFDRMLVTYRTATGIDAAPMHAFGQLLADGVVSADTIVFNNTLTTKHEFDTKWEVPVKESWHARLLPA